MRRFIPKDAALAGELLCLLLAAPALYFPNWFPAWAPWVALVLLAGGWLWRRHRLGIWLVRTPADWPIFLLFGVMLPVALWAAPDPLREQYSAPRALIMAWNLCLFYTVATHASRQQATLRTLTWAFIAILAGIALLAPLGIDWFNKFQILQPILTRIPSVLRGVFTGAESGFHGNQVAGTLLYGLPLLYALVLHAPAGLRLRRPAWWLLALLALYMTIVLVLTQSRGGLLGFGVGMMVVLLLPMRWGRWGLAVMGVLVIVTAPFWFSPFLDLLGGIGAALAPGGADPALSTATLAGRQEVWQRAIFGIEDFAFTGMGLGTFRAIMPVFYPMFSTDPDFDIAHAHNFFLQTALDFGLPGLIALLAIYLVAAVQIVRLWQIKQPATASLPLRASWRTGATGLAGCLVAQTVYSQVDAVAMGAKPSFLFWFVFAITFGAANLALAWQASAAGMPATRQTEPAGQVLPALPRRVRSIPGRIAVGLAAVAAALLVVFSARLGWTAWQVVQTAQSLSTQISQLTAAPQDVDAVAATLTQLRRELDDLGGQVFPLAPLLPVLSPLGGYGAVAAAAPELVALAQQGTALAQRALAPAGGQPPPAGRAGAATLLAQIGPTLPALAPDLDVLATRLAELPADQMAAPIATALQQAGAAVLLARVGARSGPVLAWLLGADAPRRYLVLVQDNHELRPTGGRIAAAGVVTMTQGALAGWNFVDSTVLNSVDKTPAPEQVRAHLGLQNLSLGEANWSPHFPTAAQLARRLFTAQTGIGVDGVISVDSTAAGHLLGALGPLPTPGSEVPISAENLGDQIVQFWDHALPAMAQGEQAAAGGLLPLLMQAILERSQSGIADPAATALAVAAALADRSLQVWIDNAVAAPALATAGWDGGLRPSAGADFLAVVDANLGQNKADALVERSHAYQVTWPDGPGKPALATLTLAYRHRGTAGSDPDCVPTPRAAKPYADLADRCYFNAVRVLAPAGSRLIDVEGVSVLAVTAGEGEEGTAEFATYFALPPGQEQRLVFTYRLPAELQPENYRLVVQRQAGTPPLPLRVRVDGEEAGTDVAGNTVVYTSDAAWVPAHD